MNKLINISSALLFVLANNSLALTPLVDDAMSDISGQQGLTVEIQSHGQSEIGEIRFSDESISSDDLEKGGALSLRTVKVGNMSFSFDFDVELTEAVLKLNRFAKTDISIGALQFNYDSTQAEIKIDTLSTEAQKKNAYSRLGSLYINDYTIHENAAISFKLNTAGDFLFNALLPAGSFFYLTYTDDGTFTYDANNDGEATVADNTGTNYISTKVEFDEFNIKDIKFNVIEKDGSAYLNASLSNTSGAIRFNDIRINGKTIGSAGLENIKTDAVSYLNIKGH